MQRFWIKDDFVRKYAKELSVYAQMVYIGLCCHANGARETFVGCRKLAECLGINKNTVAKVIKELEAYGLVRRLKQQKNGRVSFLRVNTVPFEDVLPSRRAGHKVVVKELSKEERNNNLIKLKRMKCDKGLI